MPPGIALNLRLLDLLEELAASFPLFSDYKQAHAQLFIIIARCLGFKELQQNQLLSVLEEKTNAVLNTAFILSQNPVKARKSIEIVLEDLQNKIERSSDVALVLCDALGLLEFLTLFIIYRKEIKKGYLALAVNPSGKTSTFKFMVKRWLGNYGFPEEFDMREIAYDLGRKIGFSEIRLFRGFDKLIHNVEKEGVLESKNLIELLWKIFGDFNDVLGTLLKGHKGVIILSDHGYDILRKEGRWSLGHIWRGDKPYASCLVPLILIRGGDDCEK